MSEIIDVTGWTQLTADQTPEGTEEWRGVRLKKNHPQYAVAEAYVNAEDPNHPSPLIRVRSYKNPQKVTPVRIVSLVDGYPNEYGDLLFDTEFVPDESLPEGFKEGAPAPAPEEQSDKGRPVNPAPVQGTSSTAAPAKDTTVHARLDGAARVIKELRAEVSMLRKDHAAALLELHERVEKIEETLLPLASKDLERAKALAEEEDDLPW